MELVRHGFKSNTTDTFLAPSASWLSSSLTEAQWLSIVPVVVYWAAVSIYEFFDAYSIFPDRQLQPTKEELGRNRAKKTDVIRNILMLHSMQLSLGLILAYYEPVVPVPKGSFGTREYVEHLLASTLGPSISSTRNVAVLVSWLSYLGLRQLIAFIALDTHIYWVHVLMHKVPWIYRNIHYRHHQMYTPYALAAQYSHVCETLFSDLGGALLASKIAGLTTRESAVFFSIATIKQVDDHSGYALPWNPLTWFGLTTGNGIVYHSVHHQAWGLKTNLENYFTFWDWIMNTDYRGPRRVDEAKVSQSPTDRLPPVQPARFDRDDPRRVQLNELSKKRI